jgi:TPR repeat protein
MAGEIFLAPAPSEVAERSSVAGEPASLRAAATPAARGVFNIGGGGLGAVSTSPRRAAVAGLSAGTLVYLGSIAVLATGLTSVLFAVAFFLLAHPARAPAAAATAAGGLASPAPAVVAAPAVSVSSDRRSSPATGPGNLAAIAAPPVAVAETPAAALPSPAAPARAPTAAAAASAEPASPPSAGPRLVVAEPLAPPPSTGASAPPPSAANASIAPPAVAAAAPISAPQIPVVAEPANPPAATASAPPSAAGAMRMPPVETAALSARGDDLLGVGDIVSARLFYERAADAGDGRAALRLGATYDPKFLARAGLPNVHADEAQALSWYRRAHALGATDAERWIKGLEPKAGQ